MLDSKIAKHEFTMKYKERKAEQKDETYKHTNQKK